MEEDDHNDHDRIREHELQLLPTTLINSAIWPSDSSSSKFRSGESNPTPLFDVGPSLDLQLSISVRPMIRQQQQQQQRQRRQQSIKSASMYVGPQAEAVKWQAAEQTRLAAMEKAYAERVREMSRREIEMAQSEFSRARNMWERAREEVEKAEKMKERASRRIDSGNCLEITCQSCRHKFRV